MKRVLLLAAALIVVAFPVSIVVAACSSSDPLPPSGTSSGFVPPVGEGGTAADGTAGDATADADGQTSTCNALVPSGPAVAPTAVAGSAPAAIGGTITPGRYKLTKRDVYSVVVDADGGTTAPGVIQRVLVFDAFTVKLAESQDPGGGGPVTKLATSSTYEIFGTLLATTTFCPPPNVNGTTAFSVVGNELWLFPSEGEREVYTRE